MYDWTGSEGTFAFRTFDVSVVVVVVGGGRVALIPFPAMPDERSEEDQQDAQDRTSGDPSYCACTQPTKGESSGSKHPRASKFCAYDDDDDRGLGGTSPRDLQITNGAVNPL